MWAVFIGTGLIVLVWYLFPDDRFVSVPAVIVAVYLVTIHVLVRRYSNLAAREAARAAV
jgi:hypothetical protein